MGQRSRRRGITNAALRSAGRIMQGQDDAAARVAQRVYNACVEASRSGESGDVSPAIWAPLVVAAETVAPVVVSAHELAGDPEEMAVEVASYLVSGFLAGARLFDREHFEAWRQRSDEVP